MLAEISGGRATVRNPLIRWLFEDMPIAKARQDSDGVADMKPPPGDSVVGFGGGDRLAAFGEDRPNIPA
jgi:hypothetical protein